MCEFGKFRCGIAIMQYKFEDNMEVLPLFNIEIKKK
jgi:hypothetical protein